MKISKNFDKGRAIIDVRDIYTLAKLRKSVYHPVWGIKAARAICNQQLWVLMKAIEQGKLFRTVKRK